ncbi:MAG: lipase [Nevskia sp.]|nr:lipase [Nevskia sp.]
MTIRSAAVVVALALGGMLLGACGSSGDASNDGDEPALETDQATLDKALTCTGFTHPDKPAVLLVHGTFTAGFEQYEWTYQPLLSDRGFDVCYVTYPDRGLGDQQVSAEYVVNAIRSMRKQSGRKIAVIGHSQGVSVTRWAIKWWPSVRAAVDDFVMEAGPNHGTSSTGLFDILTKLPLLPGVPEVLLQFPADSMYTQASNRDDETPGDISYTALYSMFDELVEPSQPVPTAAVDFGLNNSKVSNILLQDVCAGRIVDHVTIGLFDSLAFALALDAISNDGPADIARTTATAGGKTQLCGIVPIVPSFDIAPLPELLTGLIGAVLKEPGNGLPALHLSKVEPPLKAYAQ